MSMICSSPKAGTYETHNNLQYGNSPPRKVEVFLPHDLSTDNPLPVVYMNDGNTAFRPGGLSPYSLEAQKLRGVIVVAIHPVNRSYEYLPVKEISGFGWDGGGLRDYAKDLTSLKAFIDRQYPTKPGRESTTIVGASHGGVAAFWTSVVHSDCFGNGVAMSPSFWAGGVLCLQRMDWVKELHPYLVNRLQHPRLWIDWGTTRSWKLHNLFIERNAAKWGREMVKLLQDKYAFEPGVGLFSMADENGEHDELHWCRRLKFALRALGQTASY